MKGIRVAAAALALLTARSSTALDATVAVSAFPGPIQPDAGTAAGPSRDGGAIAFAASFRDAGDRYDPAATPTVFLWDRRDGLLRQVAAAGPCDQPAAASRASRFAVGTAKEKQRFVRTLVAFRSTANHSGKNADGSAEIFVWDSANGAITQITDALAGASSDPALGATFRPARDAAGNFAGGFVARYRVAFLSTSDLTGDNPANLPQVFLYDSGLPEVERLVQVSHSATGAAGPPAVDGRARRVAFLHDGGLLPGETPGDVGVYVHDAASGLRPAARDGDGAGFAWNTAGDVALDESGRFAAFSWAGGVPGDREIVVADSRNGTFVLHPQPGADARSPALARGRRRLACVTTASDAGPVPERPVVVLGGEAVEVGPPGPAYGRLSLVGPRREVVFTSDGDLDGTNASARNVLWLARFRP